MSRARGRVDSKFPKWNSGFRNRELDYRLEDIFVLMLKSGIGPVPISAGEQSFCITGPKKPSSLLAGQLREITLSYHRIV